MNVLKLKGVMVEKGFNQKMLAKRLGMSERTMQLRLKHGRFGTDEAEKSAIYSTLIEIHLSKFFCLKNRLKSENAEHSKALGNA